MARGLRIVVVACVLSVLAAAGLRGSEQAGPGGAASTPQSASAPALKVAAYIDAPPGVLAARLDNQLTVIIKPVHALPIVDVRATVRAGSLYEGKYLGAGVSHLVEHLVAEGAEHDMGAATAKEAAKPSGRVQQIGGQSNAYTSDDRTQYYISAGASRMKDCIELVAQWMVSPGITPADFEREHGVVQRELEMGKDEPGRVLNYARAANVYGNHPAGLPVIGYAAPLAALTYQDVLDYHARQYVPQNMVISVVGDVDPRQALADVCRAFAGFPAGRSAPLELPPVESLTSVRRVTVFNHAVKDAWQEMDFISIPLLNDDLYALDVLSDILTNGDASRLAATLKRQQRLVTDMYSVSDTPAWGKGTFMIGFRCEADKADAAEKALMEQLAKLRESGVTDEELDRAKRQKVAEFVYSQQKIESQAGTLQSDWLSAGDLAFSRRYTDAIQKVTADQVHQVAKKYIKLDAVAITRMVPEGAPSTQAASRPASQQAQAELFTLPNGLRVVLKPSDNGGLVSMTLATFGGVLAESKDTNGMGNLVTQLSTKGVPGMNAEQIAAFFDDAGGDLGAECGNNTWLWQATVLHDSAPKAMDVFANVVLRPTLDAGELDILRPQVLSAIDRQTENWQGQLSKFFRQSFFADTGYGLVALGSKAVVEKATAQDVSKFYREHLRAGSAVLAVVGQFDFSDMRRRIETDFADMSAGKLELNTSGKPAAPPGVHVLSTSNTTAGVIVAMPGMLVNNTQDQFPINVLDTIISGWHLPSGWLHDELRGKQLVYVVHAYNMPGLIPGAFIVYAGCQPDKAPEVVSIIDKDLRKAADYTPSQGEIDQAVNVILTAELLGNQQVSALSRSAAVDELMGLGYDFSQKLEQRYRAVTPQDVARVGRKYLGQAYSTYVTTPMPDLLEKRP